MQAHKLWRLSAWADAMYAYGCEWPVPSSWRLDPLAGFAIWVQLFAATIYLEDWGLFSALEAGSQAAWLLVSILLAVLVILFCCISWAMLARRLDNLRPYTENDFDNAYASSLAHLCADIHELEDARGRLQTFVHNELSPGCQSSASGDAGNLSVQHHHASSTSPGTMPQLTALQLLLTMKACNEMIANLRGRLAAVCHKVTGLWLTDITEATDAMLHKLKSS